MEDFIINFMYGYLSAMDPNDPQRDQGQRHSHSDLVLRHNLSTSPHNTPAPAGMGNFPSVRIGDDVRSQHKLVTEKFGLESLALVVGGSMGAQQTYEWAVRGLQPITAHSLECRMRPLVHPPTMYRSPC
jgi:hypothetical protein